MRLLASILFFCFDQGCPVQVVWRAKERNRKSYLSKKENAVREGTGRAKRVGQSMILSSAWLHSPRQKNQTALRRGQIAGRFPLLRVPTEICAAKITNPIISSTPDKDGRGSAHDGVHRRASHFLVLLVCVGLNPPLQLPPTTYTMGKSRRDNTRGARTPAPLASFFGALAIRG